MQNKIVIGTRGSDLALWQARFLQRELQRIGRDSELKIIKTQGDQIQHVSLEKLEGKGFFTKEIEEALLNKTVDVAVHSHKDLPTANTPGLMIAAVSEREDPAELLLIRKECVDLLKEFNLKEHAIIGTSSSRRKTQLQFYRPDLQINDIRGNVPTRIEKLRKGNFDAILLAAAGVQRLQLDCSDLHTVKIKTHQLIPAPAQGVLAFQCRSDDQETISLLQQLDHSEVALCISVEREVMHLFQGGCHMPIGVYCKHDGDQFLTWAMQSEGDTQLLKRLFLNTESTVGAAEKIFNSLKTHSNKSVFISTEAEKNALFHKLLINKGFQVECKSLIEISPVPVGSHPKADWIFFTSKNGVKYYFDQLKPDTGIKIAAIGEETAREINKKGFQVAFIGEGDNETIASDFIKTAGNRIVLLPQARNANNNLSELLKGIMEVIQLPVYENSPKQNCILMNQDILVFTSAMNVDAYFNSNQLQAHQTVIAIGTSTKYQLISKGIHPVHTPPFKSLKSVADLICGL